MIRANLSTRPFYNERIVSLWLTLLTVLVLAATAFNASRVIKYSRSDTELAQAASHDEARADNLREQAARLRATVDARQIELASTDARNANELIDRRTFSWTELLNRFEMTLPDDVRIAAVRPHVDRKAGTVIQVNVIARTIDDVNQLMERMSASGVFAWVRPLEEHPDEQGLWEASLEAAYVSPSPDPGKPASEGAVSR